MERGRDHWRAVARVGGTLAAVAAGGVASLTVASAHHVVSALPLCAPTGQPQAQAACVMAANRVGGTDLYDQAVVYASSDRYVRFMLWAPGTCGVHGAQAIAEITVPVGGSAGLHTATVTTPDGTPASSVGIYNWTTEILRHNLSVEWGPAPCNNQPVNVVRALPATHVVPLPWVVVGTPVSDSAVVSGGDTPTGSVTFNVYGDSDVACAGPALQTWTQMPLSGGGAATDMPFTPLAIGTYHFTATYNGDSLNSAVSTACFGQPLSVMPAQPAISQAPSAGGVLGTSIGDSASVSGGYQPAGNVQFALYGPGDAACNGTPVFTQMATLGVLGAQSDSFKPTVAGTYHWMAQFLSGDSNNNGASTGCGTQAVTITAPPTKPSNGGGNGSSGVNNNGAHNNNANNNGGTDGTSNHGGTNGGSNNNGTTHTSSTSHPNGNSELLSGVQGTSTGSPETGAHTAGMDIGGGLLLSGMSIVVIALVGQLKRKG